MSWRFLTCAALFVTCLLTANTIATKLVTVGGIVLTAGVVIFPLSYVLGDVLTEVWGYAASRRVIWLGFACNALMVGAVWLGGEIPAAPFWRGQAAYDEILGQTPRILGASFAGYLAGEFANSFVLAKMKIATKGRWLWTRTIGSTLIGQGLDIVIFISIAFSGLLPSAMLLTAILTQWIFKVLYEVVATPFTYLVVGFLKRRENLDMYDYQTNFSPILFQRPAPER